MSDAMTYVGPRDEQKTSAWKEWIERVSPLLYVRFILGPDTEDAWLCLDDGEPDMNDLAKFSSHSLARTFIAAATAK